MDKGRYLLYDHFWPQIHHVSFNNILRLRRMKLQNIHPQQQISRRNSEFSSRHRFDRCCKPTIVFLLSMEEWKSSTHSKSEPFKYSRVLSCNVFSSLVWSSFGEKVKLNAVRLMLFHANMPESF